jgi:hypothetical protein
LTAADGAQVGIAELLEDLLDDEPMWSRMVIAKRILESDVLREHDAKVWHEGLHAAYNHVSRLEDADAAGQGVMIPDPINPYRPTGAPNG